MRWSEDDLDIPIEKPKVLVELEHLTPDQLDAMTSVEVSDRITEVADAIAKEYKRLGPGSYQECVDVVSSLLLKSGSGMATQVGHLMVAENEPMSCEACRKVFPPEATEY